MSTLKNQNFSSIIFGANVFGWTLNKKDSLYILDQAFEHGINTFDTADMYSTWVDGHKGGESETILGQWMKDRKNRDQVKIITKVGFEVQGRSGLSKEHILYSIDQSLNRLQTDYVDSYLSHCEDKKIPISETLGTYKTLLEQNKVKTIGASNYSFEGLKQSREIASSNDLPQYEIYQPEYNLYDRTGFEEDFADFCLKEKIDVITYFSLASGFLSGKYQNKEDANKSQRGQGIVDKYLNDKGRKILSALDQISKEKKTSYSAVAIAWIMHQDAVFAPIVSATTKEQLKEIIDAREISFTQDELQMLKVN